MTITYSGGTETVFNIILRKLTLFIFAITYVIKRKIMQIYVLLGKITFISIKLL